MVIGVIPQSGLTANSPELTKIIGMIIAGLAAINYVWQRTALKRAYMTGVTVVSKAPAATTAALVAAAVLLVVMTPSCNKLNCQDPKNASNIACVIDGAVVDCTGVTNLQSAVAVVTPIVEKLVFGAMQADGTINWKSIEGSLINIALQYGMCVLSEVWDQLMNGGGGGSGSSGSASGSGSGSAPAPSARPRLAPADLAQEFDHIRAKVAPGYKFKTASGKTL